MNIYLIRHGQTAWNNEGRIQGNVDTDLDSIGQKQADLTGKRLAGQQIDQIFCSDLHRAVQTGEIINKHLQAELIIESGLREIKYGQWEGRQWEDIRAHYPEYVEKWLHDRINLPAPGGESFADLQKRLQGVITRIKNQSSQNVLIISHAGVLKTLTCIFLELNLENHSKFVFRNCGISIIRFHTKSQQSQLICLNDCSHLESIPN
ncbi:MAG: histidine phosphatase family protein [Bacillota bacterium]